MKDYIISYDTKQDYDGFLLCLTSESFYDYLKNIEKESFINNSKGTLLIDRLLVTGDQSNRYITCKYNCGELILDSAQSVVPDDYYRKLTVSLLKDQTFAVKNSILTRRQKQCIYDGVDFS